MALGATGRQPQYRIEPVERMDGRFLIHREYGVIGRLHVQPYHVRRFEFELEVVRLRVSLKPMRPQARAPPSLLDQIVTNDPRPARGFNTCHKEKSMSRVTSSKRRNPVRKASIRMKQLTKKQLDKLVSPSPGRWHCDGGSGWACSDRLSD
jgi:hypothetical protein